MSHTVPIQLSMDQDSSWFQDRLVERLVRYAKVHTTSDRHAAEHPSTPGQWDLARLLEAELRELGVTEVALDDTCNLIARLPAPNSAGTPAGTPVGFLAHLDTAPDFSGEGVNPQIHKDYDGGTIRLNDEHALDPESYPMLRNYVGETVITTDGSTLLGADDKAGIAEIMTMLEYLIAHPEIPRPDLEVAFTPDEETGSGLETFPVESLNARFCFTLDGTDEGGIEAECFTAYKAVVTFTGYSIHPGSARGKLANAITMASSFIANVPRSESPEATDGRYGFYCPTEVSGSIASAKAEFIIRDFDSAEVDRRIEFLRSLAATMQAAFPGGTVDVEFVKQYVNMADFLRPYPEILENMKTAIRLTGMEPHVVEIRGGTDGARLSERGIPTPNLFTGGQNLHGRYEWISARAMERATKSAIHLVELLAQREDSEA